MMGSTYKCNKCDECIRVHSQEEYDHYQEEHNKVCDGRYKSIWDDYDKMPKEKKEEMMKKVMFRTGKIGKLEDMDTDVGKRIGKILPKEKGVGG
jgi:hypothetical protein